MGIGPHGTVDRAGWSGVATFAATGIGLVVFSGISLTHARRTRSTPLRTRLHTTMTNPTPPTKLRMAVLGLGRMGLRHAANVRRAPNHTDNLGRVPHPQGRAGRWCRCICAVAGEGQG